MSSCTIQLQGRLVHDMAGTKERISLYNQSLTFFLLKTKYFIGEI